MLKSVPTENIYIYIFFFSVGTLFNIKLTLKQCIGAHIAKSGSIECQREWLIKRWAQWYPPKTGVRNDESLFDE